MFRSIRVSAPRRLSRNGRAGLPRRQRRSDAAKKSSTSASDESDDESGDETKKGRARARLDWTRSLIRMKTGLTGRKKSRRATAVKGPGTTTTPGKNNHTDRTTEADDSLSGPGSTSETKSSIAKPGSTTTTAAETSASSEKTSPGASDNSGVKSPVTEIQEPGIPETAMQQAPAVRQDQSLIRIQVIYYDKDNQKRLNHFHVVLDACVIACAYALAWFIVNGTPWFNVTGHNKSAMAVVYLAAGVLIVPFYLILYAFFHLYTPKRVQGRQIGVSQYF